jgi:hypothetical protein
MMPISSISDVDWCCCKWVENRCRFRSPKWTWVGARATKINGFWTDCKLDWVGDSESLLQPACQSETDQRGRGLRDQLPSMHFSTVRWQGVSRRSSAHLFLYQDFYASRPAYTVGCKQVESKKKGRVNE